MRERERERERERTIGFGTSEGLLQMHQKFSKEKWDEEGEKMKEKEMHLWNEKRWVWTSSVMGVT